MHDLPRPQDVPTLAPAPPQESETLPPRAAFTGSPPATLPPTDGSGTVAPAFTGAPGGYEILKELGRGGMGVVYLVRDLKLQRLVALKMILHGSHAGAADLTRFLHEAEAIAQLQHPNIVQLFESGQYQGLPYFTLEYVAGGSLADKLQGTPLEPAEAGLLIEQLARGIDYAHRQGIVHRDLKPGNVLLASGGVVSGEWSRKDTPSTTHPSPLTTHQPKITDFGLARRTELGSGLTATGAVLGTPSYMAPEQAGGQGKQMGPAGDVYALGAILYECLTGRPPFQGPTPLDTVLQVLQTEPVPPTRLQPRLPRDLETICLKCLRKDPLQRYASAEALAEDLRRWRAHEPIQARPVGRVERALKWVRRNPALATVSAAGLVALVAGAIVSLAFAIEASSVAADLAVKEKETKKALDTSETTRLELERTDKKRRQFTRLSAILALEKGIKYWDDGDATLGMLWLTRSLQIVEKQDADLERVIRSYLAYAPAFVHPLRAILPHEKQIWQMAVSPDGNRVVTGSWDGTARLWDAATGQSLGSSMRHEGKILAVAFSPDGQRIATAGDDGFVLQWDGKTARSLINNLPRLPHVNALAYSNDGKRLATGSSLGVAAIWEADSGQHLSTLTTAEEAGFNGVRAIRFAPQEDVVAIQFNDLNRLFDGKTGEPRHLEPPQPRTTCYGLAFSPDGKKLASSFGFGSQARLRLWDVATGNPVGEDCLHPETIWDVAFSPDGKLVATACRDGQLRLWEAATRKPRPAPGGQPMLHHADVECVVFSPDGKTLLTGSRDGTAQLWDVATQKPLGGAMHQGLLTRVAFARQGSLAVTPDLSGNARLWGLTAGKVARLSFPSQPPDTLTGLASFTPAGEHVLIQSGPSQAKLCDLVTGQATATLDFPGTLNATDLDATGKYALLGGRRVVADPKRPEVQFEGAAILYDLATGKPKGEPLVHGQQMSAIALCLDGKTALTISGTAGKKVASKDAKSEWGPANAVGPWEIALWDLASGHIVGGPWKSAAAFLSPAPFTRIRLCPDGETVLFYGPGTQPTVWNLKAGAPKEVGAKGMHTRDLEVRRDGQMIAVDQAFLVSVLDFPACTRELHQLTFGARTDTLCFTPDSKKLLISCLDGRCHFWDCATWKPSGSLTLPKGYAQMVAFSPDGQVLLTCTSERLARLWDPTTGQPLGPEMPIQGSKPAGAVFNSRGSHFLIQDDEGPSIYETPTPQTGDVERLVLWAQVLTGLELDAEGRMLVLTRDQWESRRVRLEQMGGPPRQTK
jgi:WD40 repeat protein